MGDLKVEKKDGRMEDFQKAKIITGFIKAGTSPEEAADIASRVETWAHGAAEDGVIKSTALGSRVLELLREVNPTAASNFEGYMKSAS